MRKEFERLAQEFSSRAAAIKCEPEEYRNGLDEIIATLQADRDASEETNP